MYNSLHTAQHIVQQCLQRGINLCATFDDWTLVAFSLATLGEDGRSLFHSLASMDMSYRPGENDKKFNNALRTGRHVTLGTLVHMARQQGVIIDSHPSPVPCHRYTQHRNRNVGVDYIDMDLVNQSISPRNHLYQFLTGIFNEADVQRAAQLYMMGSTRSGGTIFPQIDHNGRCHTGKVITYDPCSGHRDKTRPPQWLHTILMRKENRCSDEYRLRQCLFGQHLLAREPGKTVCLVEAEKTAVIASIAMPQYVWVAVGGKGGFTQERLLPLAGRQVIVFPDADAVAHWQTQAQKTLFARQWTFSSWSQDEPAGSKRDIADVIVEERNASVAMLSQWMERNPTMARLVEEFELELVE